MPARDACRGGWPPLRSGRTGSTRHGRLGPCRTGRSSPSRWSTWRATASILQFSFAARLAGKIAGGGVGKGSLKTLGGYFVEIDDVPGSDLRAARSLSLSGKTTTKLPPDLPHD